MAEVDQQIREAEAVAAEDEEAAAVQEQIRRIRAEEEEFETFDLKIIHRKNRCGDVADGTLLSPEMIALTTLCFWPGPSDVQCSLSNKFWIGQSFAMLVCQNCVGFPMPQLS
jgi:hypothetical protein